jgi:hypothetical protein
VVNIRLSRSCGWITIAFTGTFAPDMPDSRLGGELFPLLQAPIKRYGNKSKNRKYLSRVIFPSRIGSQFLIIRFFRHLFSIDGVSIKAVCQLSWHQPPFIKGDFIQFPLLQRGIKGDLNLMVR